MKIPTLLACLFLLTMLGASRLLAQVALTVSPSVTSNTYTGLITLNITGLTNTEKVVIQRWLDLNGNGAIDAGEPLMDVFSLTDNIITNSLIGGITNLNIPVDSTAATGSITAKLNFVEAMVLENMAGHYVYRVTSPTGHFAPVAATFVVTNDPSLTQSVSGIIYSNDGVTPLPYAVVVAQDQQKNNPAGAAVSDGNGHYFLTLPVSSYFLIAGMPNYYYNQKLAPSVILTNGMAATNNLTLTNGTVTISGTIYDTATSNGIPGLLMTVQSGKLFSIAFTDTNGNYSAAVSSNFWVIQPSKQRLVRRGYVLPQGIVFQPDATAGNVTNANFGVPKGNALFYGRITDNSNIPFPNIEADCSGNQLYDSKGYSDPNGYYSVAVLGDNTNQWFCSPSSGKNSTLANYVLNTFNSQTMTPGQTVLENFIALPATGRISGHVQDNSGTNIVGVGLNASANIGGNYYQSLDGTTDNSGNYSLNVAGGQWSVQFFTGSSSDDLDHLGYVDLSSPHLVNVPPTNAVLNLTVFPIGTPFLTSPQRMSSTQFGFNLNGAVNVNYTVQVSTNLTKTNWANVFSLQLTNTPVFVTDPNATGSPRFYRAQKN